ncbi:MAG: hypothetical protein ACK526_08235 [Planctomyces sp.]
MSRRNVRTEQEFGSDSFLDVIANMVGILIILIVIVGLKVARQPALTDAVTTDQSAPQIASAENTLPDPDSPESQQLQGLRQQYAELQQENVALDSSVTELEAANPDLDGELTQIQSQESSVLENIRILRAGFESEGEKSEDLRRSSEELQASLEQLEMQAEDAEASAQDLEQALVSAITERDALDQSLRQTAIETQQLHEVLSEVPKTEANQNVLQHRLSPVSEKVEEGEVHFRIENGRVSHIPVDELLDRLKSQVQARRSAVTRLAQFEGTVGPVDGYRMTYTVERDSLTPLQSMQYGNGTYRITVSKWTITPDPNFEGESVDEAVQSGSRFRNVIDITPPGSTATFWIYPNSFDAFPKLREVAHGLQLRVAARPLPEGTPIVGSPGGSRSSAQ